MIRSDEGLTLETSAFESLYGRQFTLSTQLIKPNYLVGESTEIVNCMPPLLLSRSPRHIVTVGRSVRQPFGRSVGQSFGRSVGWSVGRSVGGHSFGRSVGRSVVRSVGRSVGRLVRQPVSQLIHYYTFDHYTKSTMNIKARATM